MCPTGKEPFVTVHDARRALRNGNGKAFHTYRCDCGAWHITKMSRDRQDGVRARLRRKAQYA